MNSTHPTLDDVCEFIVDCLHKTAPTQESGFPLIRTPNIGKGRLLLDGVYRISQENYDIWTQRAEPESEDLILAREAPAGNVAIVPEGEKVALGQRTVHLRPDKKKVDPTFLCYFLLAPKQQANLLASETGATAKHVNMRDIRRLPLPNLPAIEDQKKLGSLIATYDDLIENNRRRIQLLEESARLLYQEWFVHLRFPGHEQVKITGGVPEGWDRLSVAECCEKSTYGYTASANQDAIGPKFLRITDIVPSSISWADVPYCEADEATTKKYQLKEGDIVVARTGATVGYAKRMPSLSEPVIYASYLVKFSPNKSVVDDLLLGVFMESEQYKDFVRGNAGGAAQPNANAQILGGAKLLVPSELLQKEFRSNVAPLIEQKFLLEKQNASLAKARDLLLPKLMSDELTV